MTIQDNITRCDRCRSPAMIRTWTGQEWLCLGCHPSVNGDQVSELHAALKQLLSDVKKLTAERDMWKANHDNQVLLRRAVTQRPDLADQSAGVQALETKLVDITKALTDIASGSPALHRNGTAEHSCSLCAAHIAVARDALAWQPWPAIPWTVKIE